MKHDWYLDDEGFIDIWRLDEDYHNGPQCMRCQQFFCKHCNRDWKDYECTGDAYFPGMETNELGEQ